MAHIREMGASASWSRRDRSWMTAALAGIFVFDTTAEEARALGGPQDPAVQAGRLVLEFHGWMAAEGVLPKGR